jgi:hypothetical protein
MVLQPPSSTHPHRRAYVQSVQPPNRATTGGLNVLWFVHLLAWDNLYACMSNRPGYPYSSRQRPPFIQKNLHGPPHGHPSHNSQTLARDRIRGASALLTYDISSKQAQSDKRYSDQQAGTTLPKQVTKVTTHAFRFVSEVMMNRLCYQGRRVTVWWHALQVDSQMHRRLGRCPTCPGFDKCLGLLVNGFVMKRRWVHGIEQLSQFTYP